MDGELFAKPEEFLDQTKGALEYYSKLFEYNKIFDQVYVTGWDPLSKLPNFKWVEIFKTTYHYFRVVCSFGCAKIF